MQQVTLGRKYQIVIPKEVRKRMKGLRPGAKLSVHQLDEDTMTVKTRPYDWVERAEGLMTEAWKGKDPVGELAKMRKEWGKRTGGLEEDLK